MGEETLSLSGDVTVLGDWSRRNENSLPREAVMTCKDQSELALSSRFQLAMNGIGVPAGNRHRYGEYDEDRAKQQSRRIH